MFLRNSPLSLMLRVLALFLASLGLALADSMADTPAQAMAHAIARMMESMGFNGSAGYGTQAPPWPAGTPGWPSPMSAWPGAQGTPGQSGSGSRDSPMEQMGQMGERLYQGMQGAGGAAPLGGTVLEGVWEDNQGGLLIVQGGLYRLYSQCRGYIEGSIRVTGDQLELRNNQQDFTQTFEVAMDQGRLALRSPGGQIFLYRRLVLGRER